MKKINIGQIIKLMGGIVKNACVIFTVAICVIVLIGYSMFKFTTMETPDIFATLAYAAVIAAAYKIFAIKILPVISRHIIFFAAIYASFIFIFMPVVNNSMNSKTTFYFTIAFIVLYLIGTGFVQLGKYIVLKIINKKEGYIDQFSQLKNNKK